MDGPAYTANPNVALGMIEERHKTIRIILQELRRSFHLGDHARVRFLILKMQMTEAYHFRDEEEIMAQFHYPDLNAHRAQHDRILDKLGRINQVIFEKDLRWLSENAIDSIEESQNHEEEWDVALKDFLSSCNHF